MRVESVKEYLTRGGKIHKCPAPERTVEPTVFVLQKAEPSYYEMDCDPNVVQTPQKPNEDLLDQESDSEADSDTEGELSR